MSETGTNGHRETPEPLLSVCIPTYNREPFLRQAIESVVGQMGDEVEIVVSDNVSTDGTEQMVGAFQAANPAIRYYRNAENVGPERNTLLAIERARGRYVWLLGSDDLLKAGAVDALRAALRDRPGLVMVWVNFEARDRDLQVQQIRRFLRLRRNVYFEDANGLLSKVGGQLSFISSLVLRRDAAMACLPEAEAFVGSRWVQLMLALLVARRGATAIVAQTGVVKRINYSPDDYEWFDTFAVRLNQCLRQAPRWGYSRVRIAWIMNRILLVGPIWRQVWHLKATRQPGLPEAKRLLTREYRWFPAFWLLVYPTFYVPASVASLVRGGFRPARQLLRRVIERPEARPNSWVSGK